MCHRGPTSCYKLFGHIKTIPMYSSYSPHFRNTPLKAVILGVITVTHSSYKRAFQMLITVPSPYLCSPSGIKWGNCRSRSDWDDIQWMCMSQVNSGAKRRNEAVNLMRSARICSISQCNSITITSQITGRSTVVATANSKKKLSITGPLLGECNA